MRRRAVLLGLLAASCASPEPAYYTLAPVPAAAPGAGSAAGASGAGGPRTVQLRRPGLAGYLDRLRDTGRSRWVASLLAAHGEEGAGERTRTSTPEGTGT